jgi:hypothetical protein
MSLFPAGTEPLEEQNWLLKSRVKALEQDLASANATLARVWPEAQKMNALAYLCEAHTGLADNSPDGIIAAMRAMRETIKSLNRRCQRAEAKK